MVQKNNEFINDIVKESINNISEINNLSNDIWNVSNEIINCILNGQKVILFGNGGSAADAQHIAAELIGRFALERKSFAAISLTTDTSALTAIANDYSYNEVFSRQCEGIVKEGDVVIGISTSGKSENVKKGLITAGKKGGITIGLLGKDGGNIKKITNMNIIVKSGTTARIQEAQRVIYHIICEIVETEIGKKES